jgi:tRNA threonylcarbamoyl adenosine modification protein (Sua5/YciO/YrdC/YwlC family)
VSDDTLDAAARALEAGEVVAVPTDTVYGLAVLPGVPGATDRLFAVKRRPRGVELPVLAADAAQAFALAAEPVPPAAVRLAAHYWPGALTIVVARRPDLAWDLGTGATTIGLRVPDHPVVVALCRRLGPLAVTSANRHGEPTPPTAGEVAAVFGDEVAVVVDGGRCAGAPSTVVAVEGDGTLRVLRPGRVPPAELEAVARGAG